MKTMTRAYRRRLLDSDNCHGCGRAFRHLEHSVTGHDAKNRYMLVGECCADKLVSIDGVSVFYAPEPDPPWFKDDREWFAAHSDRSHRVRYAFPDEWPVCGDGLYSVV